MKTQGKNLIFISRINADGKSTKVKQSSIKLFEDDTYELNCLSITNETYIASAMNTFVVKIKETDKQDIKTVLNEIIKKHTGRFGGEIDSSSVITDFLQLHKKDVMESFESRYQMSKYKCAEDYYNDTFNKILK